MEYKGIVTEYTTIDMCDRFIIFLVEDVRVIDVDLSENTIPSDMLNMCASEWVTPEEHYCMFSNSSTNAPPHLHSVASIL